MGIYLYFKLLFLVILGLSKKIVNWIFDLYEHFETKIRRQD